MKKKNTINLFYSKFNALKKSLIVFLGISQGSKVKAQNKDAVSVINSFQKKFVL